MGIKYTLRCPDCSHKWSMVLSADEDLPDFCVKCGTWMGIDPGFVPTQMNIGTIKGKVVDDTYRQVEAHSLIRAEAAGDPSLKITNMRDNMREGDVAAMPVNNTVSQFADEAHKAVGFDYWQANVQDNVAMSKSGPGREHTGSKVLEAIQTGPSVPIVPNVAGMKAGWGGSR